MTGPLLRKIRIVVSLIFFAITTLVLSDFTNRFSPTVINGVVYLQFVPSLLKFISLISFSVLGFFIILILTTLFGRVYCSSICPLGILQDVINFISQKIKKRNRFDFLKEQKILRLSLLALSIIVFLLGSALVINLLDPYSIYGRIAGNFIRPTIIFGNNILAAILESARIYAVYPYEVSVFNLIPFLVAFLFLGLVVVMSFFKGRLYCNTICPVGTLLGYISKYSLFKIKISDEDCLSCGICSRDCKASCIDSDNKTVDMSRCVNCFNCLTSCPTEGITYGLAISKIPSITSSTNNSRRNFLIATGVYFTGVSTVLAQVKKKIVAKKPSTVPIFRINPVSPPGSTSIERFNSKCTACNLCVSACPTQVLQPSFLEYGFLGMLQPRLDNLAGFCNFDCTICTDVCPTGALLPLQAEKKKLTQLGKAKFVKENCIVQTEKTDCGACSEHCPTKAVHMISFEGKLVIPEVREDYCIGCGACEFACPTKPYKAIYIEGNPIHLTAKKNVEEKKLEKIDYKEEFPF